MMSYLQKIALLTGVAFYALFGLSPMASPMMNMEGMESHTAGMVTGSHDMAAQDCAGTACAQVTAGSDCLEHCLQAAAETIDANILITIVLFTAIVAAIIAIIPIVEQRHFFRTREWFRPLYLFTTVRLLE